MITQQHENEIQQKAQAPSPVKQHRWRVALFSILGVVLPLVGGFAILCLMIINPDFQGWGLLLVACLLGVVGALLFRSWWAQLVVPLAFALGEFLARYLVPVVFSPDPRFLTWEGAFGVGLEAIFGVILAAIGAFMGTSIVKKTWKGR